MKFMREEAKEKFGKRIRTLVHLESIRKRRVPKHTEGEVVAVSMNGDEVEVRFQVYVCEWFDKTQYEKFLEEI
jgi:hypothetical protein